MSTYKFEKREDFLYASQFTTAVEYADEGLVSFFPSFSKADPHASFYRIMFEGMEPILSSGAEAPRTTGTGERSTKPVPRT